MDRSAAPSGAVWLLAWRRRRGGSAPRRGVGFGRWRAGPWRRRAGWCLRRRLPRATVGGTRPLPFRAAASFGRLLRWCPCSVVSQPPDPMESTDLMQPLILKRSAVRDVRSFSAALAPPQTAAATTAIAITAGTNTLRFDSSYSENVRTSAAHRWWLGDLQGRRLQRRNHNRRRCRRNDRLWLRLNRGTGRPGFVRACNCATVGRSAGLGLKHR